MPTGNKLIKHHIKDIFTLGIPLILSQVGQITVGVVDNVMIGSLGTDELAAASFANNIFQLAVIFCIGFTCIISPLTGKTLGSKEKKVSLLKNSMVLTLCMAVLLEFSLYLLADCFYYMNQPEDIVKPAINYFNMLNMSTLPLVFFLTIKNFIDGTGDTKTGMKIVLVGNLINIAANYCFIYGWSFFPEMGLDGAAAGTLTARLFMALACIFKLKTDDRFAFFSFFPLKSGINFRLLVKVGLKGLGTGLQFIMEACAFGLAGIMMGWIGKSELAAHQIAISLSSLGFMIYQGIGNAAMIKVGLLNGRGEKDSIFKVATASACIILVLASVTGGGFYFFRYDLAYLFTADPVVVSHAVKFITVLALFQIFDSLQLVYSSVTRGLADVRIPAVITFIAYFLISLPVSWYLAFRTDMGAWGIWWGFPAGLGTAFFLFFIRFSYLTNNFKFGIISPVKYEEERTSA